MEKIFKDSIFIAMKKEIKNLKLSEIMNKEIFLKMKSSTIMNTSIKKEDLLSTVIMAEATTITTLNNRYLHLRVSTGK